MALERVASAIFSDADIEEGEVLYNRHGFGVRRSFSEHAATEDTGEHALGFARVVGHTPTVSEAEDAFGERGLSSSTGSVRPGTPSGQARGKRAAPSPSPGRLVGSGSGSGPRSLSRGRHSLGASLGEGSSDDVLPRIESSTEDLKQRELDEEWEEARRDAFERWRSGSSGGIQDAARTGFYFLARGATIAFSAKLALAILFGIVRRPGRGTPSQGAAGAAASVIERAVAAGPAVISDCFRFALATGGVLGVFRGFLVLLRQRRRRAFEKMRAARKRASSTEETRGRMPAGPITTLDDVDTLLEGDMRDKAIAGVVAGAALAIDIKERRQMFALYLAVRTFDVLRNTLERRGVVPIIPHVNSILFGLCNVPIMYGFLKDPSILQKSYYNWILWMGNLSDADLEMMIRIHDRDPSTPLNTCQGPLYQESAALDSAIDWIQGLSRAARVYAPVHILPMLLLRFRALQSHPTETLMRTAQSMLGSMVFLTTYQSIVKITQIVLHEGRLGNTPGADDWKSMLAGALTGFACFFEKPDRVNELMLYCAPRSLEAVYTILHRRGVVRYVPYGELVVFMASTGVIFSQDPSDFKPVYGRLVRFLAGTY